MSPQCQGADMLRTMFASLLNSMPTGYLALLHILAETGLAHEPCGTAGDPADKNAAAALHLARNTSHAQQLPNGAEVVADTQFTGKKKWFVQKSGVINIPCGLVHFNEALHPDAESFHARRFLEKSLGGEGESHARTTKPFGGGATHCPGRVFTEKQMIGMVASIVMPLGLSNRECGLADAAGVRVRRYHQTAERLAEEFQAKADLTYKSVPGMERTGQAVSGLWTRGYSWTSVVNIAL
ncbi:hypothetical protein N7471_001911 [Penicillium samsonianum]|uniref:uncharacterized protein n=1 Tax=Penicillium samsonianum TaxID=1882272 RepID=UPI002546D7C6|nr:uncharacterized protein N7471_001911 [Penicillium samsonianum]KAJ6142458.1 hypothetical protein N7471_001911 [Penicillium samsonianum]